MHSNPLHPRTLNNKGKNMNQFLLVVSFSMYKFCILSQNIRICFNIRITFFTSERLNLHRTLHHLYSQASLTTPAKYVDVLGKALIDRLGHRGQQRGHGTCLRSHRGLATVQSLEPAPELALDLLPTRTPHLTLQPPLPSCHSMFHGCSFSSLPCLSPLRGLRGKRGWGRAASGEEPTEHSADQSWPGPHLLQLLRVPHDHRVLRLLWVNYTTAS